MRRITYRPYFFLLIFLFVVMSFPQKFTENLRAFSVASIAPSWRGLAFLKSSTLNLLAIFPQGLGRASSSYEKEREVDLLRQENQRLRSSLEVAKQWLLSRQQRDELVDTLKRLAPFVEEDPQSQDYIKRRSSHLCKLLELQIYSLPARVTFREPDSWSSSVWVNVGERENQISGKTIVAKNSPVLSGSALVGVVEYVGFRRSRVRLITDAGLVPSVRAVRGGEQNRFLLRQIEEVISLLELRSELFGSQEEAKAIWQTLHFLKEKASIIKPDLFLAKGELHGSSQPLWRSRGQVLWGLGFNYDYPDAEGPARDLRTGEIYGKNEKSGALALLRAGDMLLTTGLDGLFPSGLPVAV